MPEQYNGIPQNLVPTLPQGNHIMSTSATTPVVVQTLNPHNCTSGDQVAIRSHTGDPAINDIWEVQVVDSFHVQLIGSVSGGGGGASGFLVNLGFGETLQIPTDGDDLDAASVNISLEALADRTALLAENVGCYRLITDTSTSVDDDATESTVWGGPVTPGSPNTWTLLQGGITGLQGILQQNDLLDVSLWGNVTASVGNVINMVALYAAFYVAGGAPGFYTKGTGSGWRLPGSVGGSSWGGFHIHQTFVVPPSVQSVSFAVYCWSGGASSFSLLGDHQLRQVLRRQTSFASRLA